MAYTFSPSIWRQKQADLCKFEAIQGYIETLSQKNLANQMNEQRNKKAL